MISIMIIYFGLFPFRNSFDDIKTFQRFILIMLTVFHLLKFITKFTWDGLALLKFQCQAFLPSHFNEITWIKCFIDFPFSHVMNFILFAANISGITNVVFFLRSRDWNNERVLFEIQPQRQFSVWVFDVLVLSTKSQMQL